MHVNKYLLSYDKDETKLLKYIPYEGMVGIDIHNDLLHLIF